ncbi:hypothetical protein [Sphingomonas nostoxanthinifaciens]|uniref:hypothetical protein n=1 Tax=Sphingomonas nostoxanthinifaciens TaxID=2872652 RepID=UPI001CC1EA12|nr:hypothetical protein [Sphingomonas nostoxanthinifaciens]UAK25933.1 hypothetical protein K8P63_07375 [Sphingomonas nostoxanthinifaciens]
MATTFNGDPNRSLGVTEAARSAVSWPAIFAGAAVAIGTTLILVALGSGLGFAAASPWPGGGSTATTFAVGAGIWLIVTQWLSSALAGYITGRLRTRWTGVHTHEVLFRDTAHGLLAWAIATAIVAGVALSVAAQAVGAGSTAAASTVNYATDTLLRTIRPNTDASAGAVRAEIARLLTRGNDLQAGDKSYLASQVAAQTGLSAPEAQQRVDAAVTSIREAADKARKASSALGFFTALSMLLGAFIASAAAGYGGHLRDENADLVDRP